MTNIVCAGFGGQGVLTTGLIIAKTGMDNGKHVVWIPSYGSEMRGGTANCNVKISEDEIASPFIKSIDILIALNEPSVTKFEGQVAPGGIMVVNSSIIQKQVFRRDITVYEVEATRIATEIDNVRGTNIIMIGSLIKVSNLFEKEVMAKGTEDFFLSKGKRNPKNSLCYEMGFEQVKLLYKAE